MRLQAPQNIDDTFSVTDRQTDRETSCG